MSTTTNLKAEILTDGWNIQFSPEADPARGVTITRTDKDATPIGIKYANNFTAPESAPPPDPSLGLFTTFVFYLQEAGENTEVAYEFLPTVRGNVNVVVCNSNGQPVAQTSKSYPISPAPENR
jgi:hypothetical protein